MSGEILRQAASLMRERAEAAACAVGGEWRANDKSSLYTVEFRDANDRWVNLFECGPCSAWDLSDAPKHDYVGTVEEPPEHIASWHPAVALAVADWLEAEAANRDNCIRRQGWDSSVPSSAEIVARAYLNEPTS